jgi:hypothetical protein
MQVAGCTWDDDEGCPLRVEQQREGVHQRVRPRREPFPTSKTTSHHLCCFTFSGSAGAIEIAPGGPAAGRPPTRARKSRRD